MGRHAESPADETKLELIGGAPCLDFVNTVDPRHDNARHEYLTNYASLVSWGVHAGAIKSAEAQVLLVEAQRHPRRAREVYCDAIELREHAYEIFRSAVQRRVPPAASVAVVNGHLSLAAASRRVGIDAGSLRWEWAEPSNLERVLWPVVWSMGEVLVGRLDRIRECPGDGTCGWLFLDGTRSRTRKWCEMKTCGNRAKARRHYRRVSGEHGGAPKRHDAR